MSATPGLTGTHRLTVQPGDTAHAAGNPGVHVLATPNLALYCEIAAQNALNAASGPAVATVGSRTVLRHIGASAVGADITVTATLQGIDAGTYSFAVTAEDAGRAIMEATHERRRIDPEQ